MTLKRVLGPVQVTASGIGIIIGAGIYVLLGAATAKAGAAVWLSFLAAGLLSAFTALSYAELASMFPKSSAEYEFTRQVAPAWIAFVVGWMMTIGILVAAGAVTLGFAQYVRHFVSWPARFTALGLLVVHGAILMAGVAHSARLTTIFSLVQVAGLLGVIAIGLPHVGDVNLLADAKVGGVLGGASLVFFAFIGFDEVITLSEETRDAERTIPRALLAALAISTLLYVLVAITSVSVIGSDALGASTRPLADVIAHVMGGTAAGIVAVIAVISTFNTSLLALSSGSRMMYGMATNGALPIGLSSVHSKRQVPQNAIWVSLVLVAGFILVGNLELIASVTDFAIYLVFVAVNLTVIVLRFRQPNANRGFRSPLSIGRVPIFPLLGLAAVALMVPHLERTSVLLGSALVGLGLLVHVLLRRGASPTAKARRKAVTEVGS